MDIVQSAFVTAALSQPIVILLALGRSTLAVFRVHKARHLMFTMFSILGIVSLLAILATDVVIWFGYGVAHSGKDATTDLVVLAGTSGLVYVGAFLVWRSSVYFERRLETEAARMRHLALQKSSTPS